MKEFWEVGCNDWTKWHGFTQCIYYIYVIYLYFGVQTNTRQNSLTWVRQPFFIFMRYFYFSLQPPPFKDFGLGRNQNFLYLLVCAFRGERPIQSTKYQVWVFCENSFFGICMGLSPRYPPTRNWGSFHPACFSLSCYW